jgi:outer membrane protein OmpA-like peptidoglycan-associated protein
MRAFITALCVFLWLLMGWFLYQSSNECCHASDGNSESSMGTDASANAEKDVAAGNMNEGSSTKAAPNHLLFRWGDVNPELGSTWETYKKSLINGLSATQNLEITGLYRSDEVNNTSFENLGLARAEEIKKLLSPPLNAEWLQLDSRLVDDGVDRNGLFSSVDFRKFIKQANIDESIPNTTIIRFPPNSTNKLNDAEVEAYLDKVAERVKVSGERISLVGHTDNLGPFDENIVLGQRRAQVIRDYLIRKGVPSDKILTDSKGEASPMASNSTDSGRAQNRRTELQIIK